MKYPLIRRRRSRQVVLSRVPTYPDGTLVVLYKDRRFVYCYTRGCDMPNCVLCCLSGCRCGEYTTGNALIPEESAL